MDWNAQSREKIQRRVELHIQRIQERFEHVFGEKQTGIKDFMFSRRRINVR